MYGILDIGSNTIRLAIYTVENNVPCQIFNEADMACLASYRVDGKITEEGIVVASNSINKFIKIAKKYNVSELFAFATASLRNVSNTGYAVAKLKKLTGIDIEVICGEDEAYYDFKGSMCDTDVSDGVMLDIGGGSSEVVVYSGCEAESMISMPFGSLTLYNDFVSGVFPDIKERDTIKNTVLSYQDKTVKNNYKVLLGVGGTAKAAEILYKTLYNSNKINLKQIISLADENPEVLLNAIEKSVPKRVKTLVPGIVVFDTVMEHYGLTEMKISLCGVKEGYLLHKLGI